jgi:hypothetical protein
VCAKISVVDVTHALKMEGVLCLCILFDIEAPSLNEMILNSALALLFYICGHGFLFQSCSIENPQYAPEV